MVYDATPLIPRDILFNAPDRRDPAISPDGERMGYLALHNGAPNVWVGPLDQSAPARPVTNVARSGVAEYAFCHDDRTLLFVADEEGGSRVHLLELDTGESQPVTPSGSTARLLAHNRWHPTTALIGLNGHDVYRLDLATHTSKLVEQQPGIASWLIDTDLRVRGGLRPDAAGGAALCLRETAGDYVLHKTIPAATLASTFVAWFRRDNSALLLLSADDASTVRLLSIDVTMRAERVLAEDPRCDITTVVTDPHTLMPQALVFAKGRDEWLWLDPDIGVDIEEFRRKLRVEEGTDGEIALHRTERTDRHWLISVRPSDASTRHYLYDREDQRTTLLFSEQPQLDDRRLAPLDSFTFSARDGATLHGYVTYPPASERRGLPAVVLVRENSTVPYRWCFYPDVQWLANRGYACLLVVARSSGHHGLGRQARDDIVDAVRHAADNGWIDKTRVAIMGDSPGGAALATASSAPEEFTCVVARANPADLRVHQLKAELVHEELQKHELPHKFLATDDDDAFRSTVERFLAEQLGGRVQQASR